jgi:hypothetical protein
MAGRVLADREVAARRVAAPAGAGDAATVEHAWSPGIERAFRIALARPATADEIAAGVAFLASQAAALADRKKPDNLATPMPMPAHVAYEEAAAFVDFCLVLLNGSEFLYLD